MTIQDLFEALDKIKELDPLLIEIQLSTRLWERHVSAVKTLLPFRANGLQFRRNDNLADEHWIERFPDYLLMRGPHVCVRVDLALPDITAPTAGLWPMDMSGLAAPKGIVSHAKIAILQSDPPRPNEDAVAKTLEGIEKASASDIRARLEGNQYVSPEERIEIELKRCTKCHTIKSFGEYSVRANSADGRQAWCKVCNNKPTGRFIKEPGSRTAEPDKAYRSQTVMIVDVLRENGCEMSPPDVYTILVAKKEAIRITSITALLSKAGRDSLVTNVWRVSQGMYRYSETPLSFTASPLRPKIVKPKKKKEQRAAVKDLAREKARVIAIAHQRESAATVNAPAPLRANGQLIKCNQCSKQLTARELGAHKIAEHPIR